MSSFGILILVHNICNHWQNVPYTGLQHNILTLNYKKSVSLTVKMNIYFTAAKVLVQLKHFYNNNNYSQGYQIKVSIWFSISRKSSRTICFHWNKTKSWNWVHYVTLSYWPTNSKIGTFLRLVFYRITFRISSLFLYCWEFEKLDMIYSIPVYFLCWFLYLFLLSVVICCLCKISDLNYNINFKS